MRARMGLAHAGITCELREVVLRDKPAEMLALSPKATVPVLQLPDGTVLEESFDIIKWALSRNDPDNWLSRLDDAETLVAENDGSFKQSLDKYKYASRHPEEPQSSYRAQGETFLEKLNSILSEQRFLAGDRPGLADIAVFPFIRQFAFVDKDWFDQRPYDGLKDWLNFHLESALFRNVMTKYEQWHSGDSPVLFTALHSPTDLSQ